MTLLFNTGLPTHGRPVHRHTVAERDAMLAALLAEPDIRVTPGPAIRRVEIDAEQAIWLVTDPGHFAHPSLLCRRLAGMGSGRHVQVTGYTAAAPEVMAAWLQQFAQQDAALRQTRMP